MTAQSDVPAVPLGDPTVTDLHGRYARLRREAPVHRALMPDGNSAWLVTRYAEAREALANPALSTRPQLADAADEDRAREYGTPRALMGEVLHKHMLHSDPPDHTRLRNLVNRVFTARRTSLLRPRIVEITDELLDRLERGGERAELLRDFAFPLPLTVIGELLGIPAGERERLKAYIDVVVSGNEHPENAEAVVEASENLVALIRDLCDQKRAVPGDDLLSALVTTAEEESDRLAPSEVVAMGALLLFGGYETVAHFLSNSVINLLRDEEQLAALRSDEGLPPGAVDELLRYEGPVDTATLRYTTEPVTIGGTAIPAGECVLVSLQSVNRDGCRFARAQQLDITRERGGHLAFGHGVHYCVGAPLARLEGEIALERLFARFPDMRLGVPPEQLDWHHVMGSRGVKSLPVLLGTPSDGSPAGTGGE